MISPLTHIMRTVKHKEGEALNILTFPTHERYETGLALTGHNFYAYRAENLKEWNRSFAPLPRNYTLLDPTRGPHQIPPDVPFDLILSQNRLGNPSQFEIAANISRQYRIPQINLEHCLPHPSWSTGQILRLGALRADQNIYISDFSRAAWLLKPREARVIEHGIDTSVFQLPDESVFRKPMLLSVVNLWIERDWCCGFNFWKIATNNLPCQVVGDTPGLSEPAKNVKELVAIYQNALIFVNTSLVSPVPTALLEAMACGCCVVSTDTCMIPEIIQDGVNGFLANTPNQMKTICERLLANPDEALEVGRAARHTILQRFSMEDFIFNWNEVFLTTFALLPKVK